MTKVVIDIFMYLFELLLLKYYCDTLFDAKKNKVVRILSMLADMTVLCLIYQLDITYLNLILTFVTYALLMLMLYNVSLKTALFHSGMFVVVMLIAEIITMTIGSIVYNNLNAFETDTEVYLMSVVISKLIYFGIMMVILQICAKRGNLGYESKYSWMLLIMPLASIFVLLCFRYITYQVMLSRAMNIFWIASAICLLYANIHVFIIYEHSLENAQELFELKEIYRRQEQDETYFEILEQTNKEIHMLSHDIKNHLTQIRNLDNIDEVQKYVDNLYSDIKHFSNIGVSKNKMLDLIISKYSTICQSKNIKFDIDVKTANLSYIDDTDLSTVMNNLLDNSIEACEKSNNAFIQINIFSKNPMYDAVIVRNKSDFPPKSNHGILRTTKSNKKYHGLGTQSIKRTVKKYDAIYDWSYDDENKIFQTSLVFPKNRVDK